MSLYKNSTIVIAGIIFSNLLAYVFHFLAGRYLGPSGYGEFGALMALFLQVALPASALSAAITKFTASYSAQGDIGRIMLLRKKIQRDVFIFSAIVLATLISLSNTLKDFLNVDSVIPVYMVGLTLVFSFLLPVNRGVLQGLRLFKTYSWNTVIESLSRLLLLIIFLFAGMGVSGAILAYGLAYLIAFSIVFPFLKHSEKINENEMGISKRPFYKFIFIVLLVNFAIQSLINLPSLFVKHYYTSEFTGYWTAALNISRISLFISGAVSLVMFPEIAAEKDHVKKRKFFFKAMLLVLLSSLTISLLFFLIPELIINTLYGNAYLGAVPILEWMGFAMVFFGLLQLTADYFLAKIN